MPLLYKIPNNYAKNNSDCSLVGVLEGLNHFVYVNTDDVITDADFSNWRLAAYDRYGNQLIDNLATLNKDELPDANNYRFYFTFKITIAQNLAGRTIFLVVYENSGNTIKYRFNPIKVLNSSEVLEWTYIQYRNSTDIYNYNYDDNSVYTSSTYNNIFLQLNQIETQPEIELKQYREGSTGRLRNIKTQAAKILKLESYYFDEGLHDLMEAISVHDDILINGKTVEIKTPYTIEQNKFNKLAKGIIEVYDQEHSTINVYQ